MSMPSDSSRLEQFVIAQDPVYSDVCAELTAGMKQSHWMWFIFPQLAGLGHSPLAQQFAIRSLSEARAYHQHRVLGERLRHCTRLVLAIDRRSALQIFGSPDDLKFRSCMTLFSIAVPDESLFTRALARFFAGVGDPRTLNLLSAQT